MTEGALGKLYASGEQVVRQGDQGNCMYVVQAGKLEVIREEHDGDFTSQRAHRISNSTLLQVGPLLQQNHLAGLVDSRAFESREVDSSRNLFPTVVASIPGDGVLTGA